MEYQIDQETTEITLSCKGRIFLVDDEIVIVEDLKERLLKHGYVVIGAAASGKDAIEAIRTTPPDLVIMDIRIQGDLNGIEVAIVLQSYFDVPMPILFLTSSSETAFSYLKVLPGYFYLNKPYHEKTLIEAVERALE